MRKRLIGPVQEPGEEKWLNLERLADVEFSSEDAGHPVEAALVPGKGGDGWSAAQPGNQRIRICFKRPQPIRRIRLEFIERRVERTQEHVLRWLPEGGAGFQEIVRQQWNFSPRGSTVQTQDHRVALVRAEVLELTIVPDIAHGPACASLAKLQIA